MAMTKDYDPRRDGPKQSGPTNLPAGGTKPASSTPPRKPGEAVSSGLASKPITRKPGRPAGASGKPSGFMGRVVPRREEAFKDALMRRINK